jgi:hypothetical protein
MIGPTDQRGRRSASDARWQDGAATITAVSEGVRGCVTQKTNKLLFNSNPGSARKVSRVSLVLAHDSAGTRKNTGAEMQI